jgi:hypothetical protein
VTSTPLPAARPFALRTHTGPNASSAAPSAAASETRIERAVGMPAAAMTSFANHLLDSSLAAAAEGPNTATPPSRMRSARPSASGASGPITARSIERAASRRAMSLSGTQRTRESSAAASPSFPGATSSSPHSGSRESRHASACSRPA